MAVGCAGSQLFKMGNINISSEINVRLEEILINARDNQILSEERQQTSGSFLSNLSRITRRYRHKPSEFFLVTSFFFEVLMTYIVNKKEHSLERFAEINNGERAMTYIKENIQEGSKISHNFIRELHHFAVKGLDENEKGDKTLGAYRTWNVTITKSSHIPPKPHLVQTYMDELITFVNNKDPEKYDLINSYCTSPFYLGAPFWKR